MLKRLVLNPAMAPSRTIGFRMALMLPRRVREEGMTSYLHLGRVEGQGAGERHDMTNLRNVEEAAGAMSEEGVSATTVARSILRDRMWLQNQG